MSCGGSLEWGAEGKVKLLREPFCPQTAFPEWRTLPGVAAPLFWLKSHRRPPARDIQISSGIAPVPTQQWAIPVEIPQLALGRGAGLSREACFQSEQQCSHFLPSLGSSSLLGSCAFTPAGLCGCCTCWTPVPEDNSTFSGLQGSWWGGGALCAAGMGQALPSQEAKPISALLWPCAFYNT